MCVCVFVCVFGGGGGGDLLGAKNKGKFPNKCPLPSLEGEGILSNRDAVKPFIIS